ncbi:MULTISPECIES: DUF305 domain-containing protein [unclassified Streptomyces]|uniref:DUF305 domain-containing protein n=1 Tax=unclassified Streptomyces TaxID=2593676 RepID=UPI0005ED34DE|nr:MULTISPECIES: DUF305 domain-containing protein [unclassified Streptomyces]APU43174.1 DUF305 domain-containing protein [Streptomyces sp. TN58]KJK53623.1 copper resistance protein [Streptomyces sp. NRRL F-4428]
MTSKRSLFRRAAAVVSAGAAAVVLAACGGGDGAGGHDGHGSASPSAPASAQSPGPAGQGQHNAADAAFAKGMIPHHRQAVEMADLAPSRAGSAEVKKLAEDIRKAQDPEIRTLSGWLTSWGEQVPAENATDHSGHGMAGMMTAEQMDRLKAASGAAFDTAFMELMVEHHEGAVAMAKTEQAQGAFPAAKTMADAIITSQTAEIAQMNKLLGKS